MKDALRNTDPIYYIFIYNMTILAVSFFQSIPVLMVMQFKHTVLAWMVKNKEIRAKK